MNSYSMYRHIMSTMQTLEGNPSSSPVSPSNRAIEQQQRIEYTAVAASLGWSGWGSPVGLGILLASVGFFVLCLHWAGVLH